MEGKQGGGQGRKDGPAFDTCGSHGESFLLATVLVQQHELALTDLGCRLQGTLESSTRLGLDHDAIDHHIEGCVDEIFGFHVVEQLQLPCHLKASVSPLFDLGDPLRDLGGICCRRKGRKYDPSRSLCNATGAFENFIEAVRMNRRSAVETIGGPDSSI
jgi:hypothetical protein